MPRHGDQLGATADQYETGPGNNEKTVGAFRVADFPRMQEDEGRTLMVIDVRIDFVHNTALEVGLRHLHEFAQLLEPLIRNVVDVDPRLVGAENSDWS